MDVAAKFPLASHLPKVIRLLFICISSFHLDSGPDIHSAKSESMKREDELFGRCVRVRRALASASAFDDGGDFSRRPRSKFRNLSPSRHRAGPIHSVPFAAEMPIDRRPSSIG